MSDSFDPRDELTHRLSALGRQPVDPALQSEHLTAMAGVSAGTSFRSMVASRIKIGAAVFGGILIGATGLTTAGAMGPLQPVAKTTVEAVLPIDLPATANEKAAKGRGNSAKGQATAAANKAKAKGQDDGQPKAAKNWEGCNPDYSQKNRGQYLQSAKAVSPEEFKKARESDCGKALNDGGDADATDDDAKTDDEGEAKEPKEPKEPKDAKDAEDAEDAKDPKGRPDAPGKSNAAKDKPKPDNGHRPEDHDASGRHADGTPGDEHRPAETPAPATAPTPGTQA